MPVADPFSFPFSFFQWLAFLLEVLDLRQRHYVLVRAVSPPLDAAIALVFSLLLAVLLVCAQFHVSDRACAVLLFHPRICLEPVHGK